MTIENFLNLEGYEKTRKDRRKNNKEILEMNNGKKFDIILMNPPYSKDRFGDGLYIDFLNKCLDISDKVISVNPLNMLITHGVGGALKNKTNKIVKYINEYKPKIEVIDKSLFDAGIKGDLCIISFNGNNENIIINKDSKTYKFKEHKDINFTSDYVKTFKSKLFKYMIGEDINDYIHLKFPKIYTENKEIKIKHDNLYNHLKFNGGEPYAKMNAILDKNPHKDSLFIYIYKINASFAGILYKSLTYNNAVEYNESTFAKGSLLYIELNKNDYKKSENICSYLKTDFCKLITNLAGEYFHPYLRYDFIPWLDFSKSYTNEELFKIIGMKYDKKEINKILNNNERIKIVENNGNKFDIILSNPPFSGSLHLDFLNKYIEIGNKIVIIEPGQWLVQLKENGKYTKENSVSSKIKNKIDKYVKSVELNNYNRELHIANKTVCSITTIDFTKEYNEIDFECITEKSKVSSLKDCNLIGEDRLVSSIIKKCKNYKDHMIDHVINLKKYKDYENKGYWFIPYANYMINNLGTMQTHRWTPAFHTKTKLLDTLNSFFAVLCSQDSNSITQNIKIGTRSGNPSDSLYGSKEELENWQYFVYNNKLAVFINICLTIDEHNNSKEYIPWLVDKKYTDEEIYKLLDITAEEQELIDKTIKNFDKDSKFGKRLFSVE